MLTPIEIRQQSFNREFRGYDRVEVDAFLQEVSKVMEKQLEVNRQIKEELEKVQASYNTLKEVEDMLHKTLVQAEQSSKDALKNAEKQAELKIQEAEVKARDIVRKGVDERHRTEKEVEDLLRQRDEIFSQLKLFLNTQIDRLKGLEAPQNPRTLVAEPNGNGKDDSYNEGHHENGSARKNGVSVSSLFDDIAKDL